MAIEVTDRARNRIRELAMKRQTPDHVFRLGVRGGGCSGLSYYVDFAPKAEEKDKVFELGPDGEKVKIVIDRKSYLFLNGTIVDWKSELLKTGFEFTNPLAKTSCSCGESFTV
ncbi:MAG: iron-sulfur cluster assembly accessory protein [Deltaproteobacteria bacterium]|nr:iron-sulfur cluster assembly accessory protein [Deltaproteobacteria bacterium]